MSNVQELKADRINDFNADMAWTKQWEPSLDAAYPKMFGDEYCYHCRVPNGNRLQRCNDIDVAVLVSRDGEPGTVFVEEKCDSHTTGNLFVEMWDDEWTQIPGWFYFTKAEYIAYAFVNKAKGRITVYPIPFRILRDVVERDTQRVLPQARRVETTPGSRKMRSKVGILVPVRDLEITHGIKPIILPLINPN